MSKIVRTSKYRHVFGEVAKKENCYDDLKPTRTAWDSNYVAASPSLWAVIWEAAGGGSFAVSPHSKTGKWDPNAPVVAGHKAAVLDIDFNPFHDNMVASVSEDCYGKVWVIPEGGLTATMTDPAQTLKGHKRKVGQVKFHPTASNVLATAASDFSVKVWDVEKGDAKFSFDAQHSDIIQSLDWNYNGSLMVTTCKDKKARVIDPRHNKTSSETEAHSGVKGSRAVFLGKGDRVFTVGFTKSSEREYALWDLKDLSKPLARSTIDSSSGILVPYFDSDTSVMFLAGKGDGNIRYYEIVDDQVHYLTEFKTATPLRGIGWLPKRAVDVSNCEIDRALKLSTKTLEPVSFVVPRKSDMFQDDIFPDCFSGVASLTGDDWCGGKDAEPKTGSMQNGFVKKDKPADFNPVQKAEEKELSVDELKKELEKAKTRIAFLEAEAIKKDAKIKELSG